MYPSRRKGLSVCFFLFVFARVGRARVDQRKLVGTFSRTDSNILCPSTLSFSSFQEFKEFDAVRIPVSSIEIQGNACSGRGFLNLAVQNDALVSNLQALKGRGSGSSKGVSGGSSKGSTGSSSKGSSGSGSSGSRTPTRGISIPTSAGRGTSWLASIGTAWSLGAWRGGKGRSWKRRRRGFVEDGEEDEFEEISEVLDQFNIPHFYGYYTDPSLIGQVSQTSETLQAWNFRCSQYGMEFRTRILSFKLDSSFSNSILSPFAQGVQYLLISGISVNGFVSNLPCQYSSNTNPPQVVESQPRRGLCFPADALVTRSDGSKARMDALDIGDHIAVGPGKFSKVFMFFHKDAAYTAEFVELITDGGASVQLTHGHNIYANEKLVPAGSVRAGDFLRSHNNTQLRVHKVNSVFKKGIYNPQTLHGDIVVDGIIASTYATALRSDAAHSALSPLRAIFRVIGSKIVFRFGVPFITI